MLQPPIRIIVEIVIGRLRVRLGDRMSLSLGELFSQYEIGLYGIETRFIQLRGSSSWEDGQSGHPIYSIKFLSACGPVKKPVAVYIRRHRLGRNNECNCDL